MSYPGEHIVTRMGDSLLNSDQIAQEARHKAALEETRAESYAMDAEGYGVPSSDQIMILDRADDAKYVIFKIEDWDNWVKEIAMRLTDRPGHMGPILLAAGRIMVDDGIVIRRQEFFAAPALHAYANAISVAIKAMRSDRGGYNEGTVQNLRAIADYFHTQAALAEEEGYKIPD